MQFMIVGSSSAYSLTETGHDQVRAGAPGDVVRGAGRGREGGRELPARPFGIKRS